MDKIFLGKEHNPDLSSPEAFLFYYLTERCPATYFENGTQQCLPARRRSLDDLNLLVASYFPDWDPENLFDALVNIWENNKNLLVCINFCTTVKKFVVVHNLNLDKYPFVYALPYSDYYYKPYFAEHPSKDFYIRFFKKWSEHPMCIGSNKKEVEKFLVWIEQQDAKYGKDLAEYSPNEVVETIG